MKAQQKNMRLPKNYLFGFILLFFCSFATVTSQNIQQLEYYFGTDPGLGNGTLVTANANTGELTQALNLPITSLNEGFHKLTVRAQDNLGTWGLYQNVTFYVSEEINTSDPISNIAGAEYWFNTDPGQGNGNPLTISGSPSETSQNFAIPLGTLDVGFHNIGIRTRNLNGTWSLYDKKVFYVSEDIAGGDPISNIAGAEYWFNTDPGQGNGNPLTISGNPSDTSQNFVIPLGTLDVGFHTIGLRTQNLDGTWSLYDNKVFYVSEDIAGSDPVSNIAGAEYWFDADPGQGNGNPLTISGSPNETSQNFVIPLGTLAAGFHKLGMRIQNLNGDWSLYEKKIFYVFEAEDNQPPAALAEAEFLYDAELGFDTGTAAALTPTGNTDEYLVEIPTNLVTCDLHDIWLSIKNADGNYSLYKIALDVDVYDDLPPTIMVHPNITAELDANGQASITIADVNNGTFDDCELVSVVLNQTQFDYTCANLGTNTVTITATDAEDKVSTQDVTITVVDSIDPVAISQDITIQLDANGVTSITPSEIENGSTDNCSIASSSLDVSAFTCTNLGANTVTFTVEDTFGNSNSTTAIVTIEDGINPTAITQNITVQLDVNGDAVITPNMVNNNSTDNCTIASSSLDITAFTCANLGNNTVILTVTDQSNNSDTETAIITVEDSVNPTVIAQNITVQLDANGTASIVASQIENGSSDNCAIASSSLDITSFSCGDLGTNTVTLSVTDSSNNTGTATAIVTVEDGINPTASTQNITVQLDASGSASITPNMVDNNSTDNCSIASSSLDITTFTCDDIGENTVTLTVNDAINNSDAATAIITVQDTIDPAVAGQDITVDLEGNPWVTITPEDVDNGSSDNCTFVLSIDTDTFSMVGDYPVTLTITDGFGNATSITITVTVVDSSLSIEEETITKNQIKIFPVPTEGILNISTNMQINEIVIFNLNGKKVIQNQGAVSTMDVSKLEVGMYLIRFKVEGRYYTKRIIKN
ncbi:T9SS type A sorting domain-containing protein [Lacinutrix sp. WUR7]|uniref:T9SS type A sorting domain-containing protein n=1 Tax=Lacinutrix sp. WUR7 TaxID=2653681 RepID=UPI00193D6909|nr:T9SS type A sorting domain-containing protein [Lacinutrix sp. WUR7]QRM89631.1 T9SS type A sorting domain-containing protein [Lacinutrix sp. WUR7]